MWFCKKKKTIVLNADQAYHLTKLNIELNANKRRQDLLEHISSVVQGGHYFTTANRGHYAYWLRTEDIPYLKSLGFEVLTKMEKVDVNGTIIYYAGQAPNQSYHDREYYEIRWDKSEK